MVGGRDGEARPLRLSAIVEELVGVAQIVEALRGLLPQQSRRCIPLVLDDCGVQIADRGGIGDRAIGVEDQIVGADLDHGLGVGVVDLDVLEAGHDDVVAQRGVGEDELGHLPVVDESDTLSLQVAAHRQDDRFVLVVRGSGNALQRVDPRELQDHPVHVAAQFGYRGDILERERGLPHPPEVRLEELRGLGEPLANRDVVEFMLSRLGQHHEFGQQIALLVGELHVPVAVRSAHPQPVRVDQPTDVLGRMGMVEIKNLLGDRFAGVVERGHAAKDIPEVLVGLLVEHAPTAVEVAPGIAQRAVAVFGFEVLGRGAIVRAVGIEPQHRDLVAVPATVANQIDSGREVPDPRSNHVCVASHASRLNFH
ncbi:hypothetical protein SDC9_96659 [bioreactor metagenome]|uniref:Uncharacterized protein n=1 Tax=bioreactor metagenome TaxID=1076179 RepID=A0A645A9N5_9ZZZZ